MTGAGWTRDKEVEPAIDELKAQVQKIYNAGYQQGRVAVNVDALVDRFLAWPLPASVCSDLCATKQGSPHRSGTNLLSAVEAKAMIEHVLGIAQQAQDEKGVRDAGN